MTSPAQGKEESQATKRPSAKKRQRQNEKCRIRNKAARSCIKTKLHRFRAEIGQIESEKSQSTLSEIQGMLDKAAKKGLFKANKASRLQSRLAARLRVSSSHQ
jgi:small subunit ribosomal protein S20